MTNDNPILNNPYKEPLKHYDTDSEGCLDYKNICNGRRIFKPDSAVIPIRQSGQKEMFEVNRYTEHDFTVPYGKDRLYYTDFITRIKSKDGVVKNLMIEISGMSKDKARKKWFVENRWLPAVNAMKDKYDYPEWHFIEIANDIRNIRNQLIEKIQSV